MNMEKRKRIFNEFMADVILHLQEEGHAPAAHVHRSTLRSFTTFLDGRDVYFREFTPVLLKRYEGHLQDRGLSLNTISTYLRALRATYNKAVECGLAQPAPGMFRHVYTGVDAPTKRALTPGELEHVMTAEVPCELKQARAWFALMFLLRGMPFIDLAHLRKCDYNGGTISYSRHKTRQVLHIRVPVEAQWLIEEYADGSDSVYLFPILHGEGGGYGSALRTFNKQLYRLAAYLLPRRRITSYTARHSWATIAFHQDVPVGVVSRALGHTSIRTTESYLAPLGYEKIDAAHALVLRTVFKRRKDDKCLKMRDYSVSNRHLIFCKGTHNL